MDPDQNRGPKGPLFWVILDPFLEAILDHLIEGFEVQNTIPFRCAWTCISLSRLLKLLYHFSNRKRVNNRKRVRNRGVILDHPKMGSSLARAGPPVRRRALSSKNRPLRVIS